jgi:tetratricopeptide (TPR) repeat protein
MANSSEKPKNVGLPDLSELLTRYLQGRMGSHEAGLGLPVSGEVIPHEAAPSQPADPKLAWEESLAVLPFYSSKIEKKPSKAPPDWPALVAAQEPVAAVAFCLGNFPQLVRSLQPLLRPSKLQPPRPTDTPTLASSELVRWARQTAEHKRFPAYLMAAGTLRLAKDFDQAEELLSNETDVPAEWRPAWANERAALSWHRGQYEEALASWLSQEESVPVLFNRGTASLFLKKRTEARDFLKKAVGHLPESGAWHHLGRLYLALGEM